ncbi:ANTAR domain-containing response regulator [Senegalia massiliensis]|uniref:ANTAR domain-containing response regulator n=1 Tax=Senegalia massiliensis TaxID=1720316 RepID=UPI00103110E5|nr:ANTAR domain-containing protein [Senegalia massiliensis]
MSKGQILICDSSEYIRKNIKNLLYKRGYKVYEATNGLETLRLARTIYPDIVILDVNLWGMNSFKVGNIIEEDNISTVLYMTNNLSSTFLKQIETMKIYSYIKKPIINENLYQMVEFALINSNRIKDLEKKIEDLNLKLESRKIINKAKIILIEKYKISEDEAYNRIRKQSMDRGINMEKLSNEIISDFNKKTK